MTTTRCRYFIKLVFIALVTTFLIYYSTGKNDLALEVIKTVAVATSSSDKSVSKKKLSESEKENQNLKRILYWNDFYGSKNFGFCCGRGPYFKNDCQYNTCYTSKNRNTNISSYDAIVFHGREIIKKDLPKIRLPHQLYVFLTLESAAYTGPVTLSDWDNFFNISMTYRQDSDVFLPYGRVVEAKRAERPKRRIKLREKKYLGAWLVSNCKTHSGREDLVRQLEKYLPPDSIHIYGQCGNRTCPGTSLEDKDGCWKMIEENYKFYFSLENSVCRDYVTEKIFEALKRDVVPIVLGGAEYKNIFPDHSFINMLDYKNMSQLAEHLLLLGENEEKYSKYFEWKTRFEVRNSKYDFNQAHCNLCQLLHDNSKSEETRVIEDLNKWFVTESHCKRISS